MDKYISLRAATKMIEDLPNCYNGFSDTYDKACIIGALEEVSPANVKPVEYGYWQITEAFPHNIYCSVCHKRYAQEHWQIWEDGSLPRNYCPHCGAHMSEEIKQ